MPSIQRQQEFQHHIKLFCTSNHSIVQAVPLKPNISVKDVILEVFHFPLDFVVEELEVLQFEI